MSVRPRVNMRERPIQVTRRMNVYRESHLKAVTQATPTHHLEAQVLATIQAAREEAKEAAKKNAKPKSIPIPPVRQNAQFLELRAALPVYHPPVARVRYPARSNAGVIRDSDQYDLVYEDLQWLQVLNGHLTHLAQQQAAAAAAGGGASMDQMLQPLSAEYLRLMIDLMEKGAFYRSEDPDCTSRYTIADAKEAVALKLGFASDTVVEAVYRYWIERRLALGKALMRYYQKPPEADEGNVNVAFLPRHPERRGRASTRNPRRNDASAYIKMRIMKRDLLRARHLFQMVRDREVLKRDRMLLDSEAFDLRLRNSHFSKRVQSQQLLKQVREWRARKQVAAAAREKNAAGDSVVKKEVKSEDAQSTPEDGAASPSASPAEDQAKDAEMSRLEEILKLMNSGLPRSTYQKARRHRHKRNDSRPAKLGDRGGRMSDEDMWDWSEDESDTEFYNLLQVHVNARDTMQKRASDSRGDDAAAPNQGRKRRRGEDASPADPADPASNAPAVKPSKLEADEDDEDASKAVKKRRIAHTEDGDGDAQMVDTPASPPCSSPGPSPLPLEPKVSNPDGPVQLELKTLPDESSWLDGSHLFYTDFDRLLPMAAEEDDEATMIEMNSYGDNAFKVPAAAHVGCFVPKKTRSRNELEVQQQQSHLRLAQHLRRTGRRGRSSMRGSRRRSHAEGSDGDADDEDGGDTDDDDDGDSRMGRKNRGKRGGFIFEADEEEALYSSRYANYDVHFGDEFAYRPPSPSPPYDIFSYSSAVEAAAHAASSSPAARTPSKQQQQQQAQARRDATPQRPPDLRVAIPTPNLAPPAVRLPSLPTPAVIGGAATPLLSAGTATIPPLQNNGRPPAARGTWSSPVPLASAAADVLRHRKVTARLRPRITRNNRIVIDREFFDMSRPTSWHPPPHVTAAVRLLDNKDAMRASSAATPGPGAQTPLTPLAGTPLAAGPGLTSPWAGMPALNVDLSSITSLPPNAGHAGGASSSMMGALASATAAAAAAVAASPSAAQKAASVLPPVQLTPMPSPAPSPGPPPTTPS